VHGRGEVVDPLRLARFGEFQRLGAAGHRAEARNRGQQRPGVGVFGALEDAGAGAFLDHVAPVHHHHPVGDLGHHAHVVGDEQHRHADLGLQRLDQLQDLRLDGDVQRRGRLVGDQQVRPAGQRHGDHHPLAHAAGEQVRIVMEAAAGAGDADLLQDPQRRSIGLRPVHAAVVAQRLGHLEADGQHRVEAGHRLLEDHRDVVAAHLAHRRLGQGQQVAVVQEDLALDPAVRLRDQPHDRQRGDRLAGTGLADDGHRLVRRHIEVDAVDGGSPLALDPERGA
jgi:hypothetical protein